MCISLYMCIYKICIDICACGYICAVCVLYVYLHIYVYVCTCVCLYIHVCVPFLKQTVADDTYFYHSTWKSFHSIT